MTWIDKDDVFFIRKTMREIFNKYCFFEEEHIYDNNLAFDCWLNQFIPPVYYESTGTIKRHLDQIIQITKRDYKPYWIWIKRNNQLSCAIYNNDVEKMIKNKSVILPDYLEIEKEKRKWQATPGYNKENGVSEPLIEEYIQINFKRR